jgi:hypothetical protein
MTPDRPDGADLLATARSVIEDDWLPLLPAEKRLDGLMVLAILAAAERELADAGGLQTRQAERLAALLPHDGDAAALCERIRTGAFDKPEAARRLHALLLEDVRDRLALVNPKYLAAADRDEPER